MSTLDNLQQLSLLFSPYKSRIQHLVLLMTIIALNVVISIGLTVSSSANASTINTPVSTENQINSTTSNSALWATSYYDAGGRYEVSQDMIETSNGDMVVVGYGFSPNYAWIRRIHNDGSIIWTKRFDGPNSEFASVQETDNGEFVATGSRKEGAKYDAWVVKFDGNGSIIWEYTYGGSEDDFGSSIIETGTGKYVIAGLTQSFQTNGTQSAWLFKLDTNGLIEWQRFDRATDTNLSSELWAVTETTNGNIVAAGGATISIAGITSHEAFVWSLDSTGTTIWRKTYGYLSTDEGFFAIQKTQDGGLVVAGYAYNETQSVLIEALIMKLNSDGAIVWQERIGTSDNQYPGYIISSVEETSDGGFIIAGGRVIPNVYETNWVAKLDSSGNILWQIYAGGGSASAIHETQDHKYVMSGGANGSGLLLIKMNQMGEIPGCTLINNSEAVVKPSSVNEQVYNGVISTSTATRISSSSSLSDELLNVVTYCNIDCADMADNDGDSLPNGWEACGYDHNGDGIIDVDLPRMGADPNHKDIFVEVDYMVGYGLCSFGHCFLGHTHKPKDGAIARVVHAFANSPVSNPDGIPGIHLHVDYGPDAPLTYGTTSTWSELSQSDELEHLDTVNLTNESWDDWRNWAGFDRIKTFQEAREQIFHYAIFSHDLGGTLDNEPISASGISRNDFISGSWELFQHGGASEFVIGHLGDKGNELVQAVTFMHELGHNLGLHHAGTFDDVNWNYEPNYLSVMNYTFSHRGLIKDSEYGYLDYSFVELPPLDEAHLNEAVGLLGGSALDDYGTRWSCLPSDKTTYHVNSPINWNCSFLSNEPDVSANINFSTVLTPTILTGYNDWANLTFDMGSIGGYDTPATSFNGDLIETPLPEFFLLEEAFPEFDIPYDIALSQSSDVIVSPGISATIPFTLTNQGFLTATVSITVTLNQSWFDISSIPMMVSIVPSASITFPITITVPATSTTNERQGLIVQATIIESPRMTDTVEIRTFVGPKARFNVDHSSGIAPHSATFTNLSVGQVDSWLWNFGDGSSSTLENPVHVFVLPGVYTVTLSVFGADGVNTLAKENYIHVYEQVETNFTGLPIDGIAPLIVGFTNLSTGDFHSSQWSFGDGESSTLEDPSHTYISPGTYTVTLTTTGLGGTDTLTRTNYIDVYEPVEATFTGTPTNGIAPLTVDFTNLTTGDYSSSLWNFGDGANSNLQNPSHTYLSSGIYTVTLTSSGLGGTDTFTQTDYIEVYEPVEAMFFGNPTNGTTPLTVHFTNTSTGNYTSSLWDFGDGSGSTVQNPSHDFIAPGSYTVTLTATGLGGTDTLTRTNYITVYEPVQANFNGVPTSGIAPLTVNFTNLSTGDFSSSQWDFGDGTTSTLSNPSHTFLSSGIYTITLTVGGLGGSNTITRTNYITAYEPVNAHFVATPLTGIIPLTVNFSNLSSGDYDSCLWTFGDGTTSTDCLAPSHIYHNIGVFTVTLTISGLGGNDVETKTGYITVNEYFQVYLPLILDSP